MHACVHCATLIYIAPVLRTLRCNYYIYFCEKHTVGSSARPNFSHPRCSLSKTSRLRPQSSARSVDCCLNPWKKFQRFSGMCFFHSPRAEDSTSLSQHKVRRSRTVSKICHRALAVRSDMHWMMISNNYWFFCFWFKHSWKDVTAQLANKWHVAWVWETTVGVPSCTAGPLLADRKSVV